MKTPRPARIIALVAVVGLIVSVVALWSWPGSVEAPVDSPVPGPLPISESAPPSPRAAGEPIGRSPAEPPPPADKPRPDRIQIETIGIDAPLAAVGVSRDGQMQLPPDPRVLGWYEFSPLPGATSGSSVLAGHLDSKEFGLGPLVRLRELGPGDDISIELANGDVATYAVTSLQRFARRSLPPALFNRSGPAVLHIITCGGEYDARRGGYQQNLVVTAVPS